MARGPLARVVDNQLIHVAGSGGEQSLILVGTSAWYDWLNAPETRSFSYDASEGRLTVRRELRQNRWYWYAYRTCQGKLCKVYLGKTEELSQHRLACAWSQLSEVHAQRPQAVAKRVPTASPPVILKTRLIRPLLPEHLVSRPRVLALLHKGATKPLTLICAPAGFGKTALMREWVAQSERLCAWISLDREMGDVWCFLAHLLSALQHIQPNFGSDLLTHVCLPSPPPFTEILASLLNQLVALPDEVTIIFDNYHLITDQHIHDALAFLLEHLPPHVHMLVASRSALEFPLARLRVSEKIVELDADDLRFTSEETAQLLLTTMHLALEPVALALLEAQTEGWVAGLYLAAMTLQEGGHLAQDMATLAGSQRFVLIYVLEEILAPQSEQVQAFLLATALLERFNADLCCAVTGQAHAKHLLEYLEYEKLLLIPCEEQVDWYRYPQLWAEALRHHLECTQPELAAVLHLRASQWFEAQGMSEEAIKHAFASHDEGRAITLIEEATSVWLEHGEIATLRRWLDALPDGVVRASPRLCISKVWLTFIASQAHLFLSWIQAAEQALQMRQEQLSPPLVRELQAEIVGLLAFYQFSYNDSASAIVTCNQALLQLPAENLYPRSLLLLALGFASTCGINVKAGAEPLLQASQVIQARSHALLLPFLLIGQAEIALAQGSLTQAVQCSRQILALATKQDVLAVYVAGLAHFGLGRAFWEWNNLEMAKLHLLQAWDLGMQTQTANTLFMTGLLLVQVVQAQKDAPAEDFWGRRMEELGRRLEQTAIPAFVAAMHARRWLSEGNVEAALLWMHEHQVELEVPDRRHDEFKRFTQVRVLLAAARASADEAYVQQALAVLGCLRMQAEEAGNVRVLLESLILQTLAFHQIGEPANALAALTRAVTLAEPGKYLRLFVSEGNPLARLLRQLLEHQRAQRVPRQNISLTYLSNLLKAFAVPTVSSQLACSKSGEPLLDPLSWREREVLCLLAAGHKNREIAKELVVVTGTVKAHINTIYQKLGVNNRVQAVERARTLGLL